jgi:phosphoglycolate phosphatase-like HAD superfamily hydrolase
MKAYLFDIDGTLADCSHRLHHIQSTPKDWDSFFAGCDADSPIQHIIEVARTLGTVAGRSVVYVSGRSDQCREQTAEWLFRHHLPAGPLYMRKAGDHRADDVIKLELLERLRADGYEPVLAFDDRNRVVQAWRSAGIPCAQVAEGNF